ncbi:MAG: hypothetical protein HRU19_24560 [Pseudobacteriovorax sp.]|nr:hypothetical protein [Pseudobacteriovorax sp.]
MKKIFVAVFLSLSTLGFASTDGQYNSQAVNPVEEAFLSSICNQWNYSCYQSECDYDYTEERRQRCLGDTDAYGNRCRATQTWGAPSNIYKLTCYSVRDR